MLAKQGEAITPNFYTNTSSKRQNHLTVNSATSQPVPNIIIECAKFSDIRNKLKVQNSLKENLGNPSQVEKTIKFLKETNLFTLI